MISGRSWAIGLIEVGRDRVAGGVAAIVECLLPIRLRRGCRVLIVGLALVGSLGLWRFGIGP
jgi:hypothetical protein